MRRGRVLIAIFTIVTTWGAEGALAQLREQSPNEPPALEETPSTGPGATPPAPPESAAPQSPPKETLARVFANEPPLVRLARDKFGDELTENDAKFFTAVAANEWADFRPSKDATYNTKEFTSWKDSPHLNADRIVWLCTDPAALKLVSPRGIWLRGANIRGQVNLYRSNVPFSLTICDCLISGGLNIIHAKVQELDIRNCCSNGFQARGAQIAENVYLVNTCIFGGAEFVDAQIGGDFNFVGGLAFHGSTTEELKKKGIALNFHDAKIGGDIKLIGDSKLVNKFRAYGQVRLIGAQIGRSFVCSDAEFNAAGMIAIDARASNVASNISLTTGFIAGGGVVIRRARIGGELDCSGGRFIAAPGGQALDAEMVNVGGQINFIDGFHAEGEVRLTNAVVAGDVVCTNAHFLNPSDIALGLDGATIGRSLKLVTDPDAKGEKAKDLPAGFLARGLVRLWGTQVAQDVIANGAQFDGPRGIAILACNMKVGSRLDLSNVKVQGLVNLASADVEHELDLRNSHFDAETSVKNIAFWAPGIHVRGHVYGCQTDAPEGSNRLRVDGCMSFEFATIGMHWDMTGARLVNPTGGAFDASDCRVGGYVNLDGIHIDGRASFSRAKIDGIWLINNTVEPEKMRLDMRFAHIWVIKDERLEDWPPAGQLQLEGLVYDHFDDDSPLDVYDRLAWLRRQYAPIARRGKDARRGSDVRRGSPDPAESADRRSPGLQETFGQTPVRGQETRAQQDDVDAQQPEIVSAQFQVPVSPPRMAAPMPMPTPMPMQTVLPTRPPDRPYSISGPEVGTGESMSPSTIGPYTPDPSTERLKREQEAMARKQKAEAAAREAAAAAEAARMKAPEKPADVAKASDATPPADAPPAEEKIVDPAGRRYITQPYTQLASVYRAIGQDEQANTVLVARAERIGELSPALSAQGLWYRYIGRLIGYGYEPFRAIKIGVVIILVGALVFAIGARRHLMAETKLAERVLSREGESGVVSPTYPRFNAVVYSLDVFLPFVDLNQVCYWIPGEKPTKPRTSRNCLMHIGPYSLKWSSVLHGYLWFQTLAGWTLCTLLAAAVTGIVQS